MVAERVREDLVKAARMYFLDGASQQEIASVLGTSRSNVSRMLAAAREQGIVEIRIIDGTERRDTLEAELKQRFGLHDCQVAAHTPGSTPAQTVSKLSSQWLLDNIQDGQRLALSWGTALQAMVWAVTASRQYDVEVVQLVGGLSAVDAGVTGQELVRELATRLGARYRYLHAPALVANLTAVEAFLSERSVSSALDAAKSADIAFVGVGTYGDSSSAAIIDAMALSPADRAELDAMSPAGDICARYYDINGAPVASRAVHDHVIAVDLDDLRRVPMVVGVTSGRVKAPGLVGALRGGHLDVLICDEAAARAALALDAATPRLGTEGM
ncbi:sugar-binding transcriptional regulator [Mycolicibacterium cosmeticum]|uniref:Transcriptional regulator, sugar-binding family protein n=1 Tax=Mycolicibacterium cosmeticum TaxID=258533 RepID=W9AJL9_MYCCO|nr:sugar-binding transcriptional regulator [Mycolicibacterium cosmeticum]TLH72720.1 sugar-binding transcriptional regulator [Mycolicibacterium cosmeticum]CDO05648.1 transcriptional regulator, sugar-binding family protein [Mycolicibacterium cosmeticum]